MGPGIVYICLGGFAVAVRFYLFLILVRSSAFTSHPDMCQWGSVGNTIRHFYGSLLHWRIWSSVMGIQLRRNHPRSYARSSPVALPSCSSCLVSINQHASTLLLNMKLIFSANSSAIIDCLRRCIINTMSCLPLSWINSKPVIIPSGCHSFRHFLLFDYYYLLYPCSGSSWCDALPGIFCFFSLITLNPRLQFVMFIYSLRQIPRPLQQLLVNLKYFHKCPHRL